MKPFIAMIVPVESGAHPDHELPQPPQPGRPPAGGGEHPDHTLPGELPHPEHPIWYPLPPGMPVDPDYGVPGGEEGTRPPPGGVDPGFGQTPGAHPEHPIVLPPDQPGQGGGWGPIYIWGGGPGARPPIQPPEQADLPGKIEWKVAWTPATGWVSFGIVMPEGEHVTPSQSQSNKARRK